ncbi:calcium-activated chloride channel regulator 4-like [Acanthaster planci]|uniref:Calcium-activated chloride channel regulator 4-like n=1 Tax=Acanthaster planci TaxID=133434 RepID=A0A8B7XHQ6_ACAPL|nr:calcium-activated chloride channel regulator 4-like [Acanthaster planci]
MLTGNRSTGGILLGLIAFILNVALVSSSFTKPDWVELLDNGYSGVVVAIHDDVPESMELILAVKELFSNASRYLYRATKRRAFFKNVTIVIPQAWAWSAHYGPSRGHHHDVIVMPANQHWAPDPYTNQYQGCGERGISIRLGADFLLDPLVEKYYGPRGRLLVHEWGYYRWGLFNEYPDPVTEPDVQEEFYFSTISNKFQGISCSSGFPSQALAFDLHSNRYWTCAGNDTVGYEEGCAHVTTDDGDVTQPTGSIMYGRHFYNWVVNFCDSDDTDRPGSLHDREAPTRHNRLCGGRSCWDIMRQHNDFKDDANLPRNVDDAELQPTFNLVQARDKRVVLLIDSSSSMRYDNRFDRLRSAAAHFIQSVADNSSHVGIVHFNEVAHICSGLVQIRSESDRQFLLDSLPIVSGNSSTNYSKGLLVSLQVLSFEGTRSAAGGIVLLFADGGDNDQAATDDAVVKLVEDNVIVDTVALARNPRTFPDIAAKTGGTSFHFQTDLVGLVPSLYQAFAGLMIRSQSEHDSKRRIIISSFNVDLARGDEQTRNFSLDDSVGRKTEVLFTWTEQDSIDTDIILTSPSGVNFNSTYLGYQNRTDFKYLTFSIQGTAETGPWEVRMRNPSGSDAVMITTIVTSYARSDDVEPIVVAPMLSSYKIDAASGQRLSLFAEVRQGLRPVVGARVVATVYPPGGYPERIVELLDNGAGADVRRNDGVYTRYYVDQPNQKGFNTVQVTVNNGPNTTALNVTSQPRIVADISPKEYAGFPKIGNFRIFAPGTKPRQLQGTPVTDLSRQAAGITAYYASVLSSPGYVLPPCRVQDLRAVETWYRDGWMTVTLSWTAPGEDADRGTASLYDIRYAQNVATIVDNFDSATPVSTSDVLRGNMTQPRASMNAERFTVRVPIGESATSSPASSVIFALKAADGDGRFSEMSNVARATFRSFVPEPALPSPSTESAVSFSTSPPESSIGTVQSTSSGDVNQQTSEQRNEETPTAKSTSVLDGAVTAALLSTAVSGGYTRTHTCTTVQSLQLNSVTVAAVAVCVVVVVSSALIAGMLYIKWKHYQSRMVRVTNIKSNADQEHEGEGQGSGFYRLSSTSSTENNTTHC